MSTPDITALLQDAYTIRGADTPNSNTAERVGKMFVDIVEALEEYVNSLSDKTYIHQQNVAAATWQITHNLGKYPSVTVVDSSGRLFFGDVQYVDANNLSITFHGSFSGKAILN